MSLASAPYENAGIAAAEALVTYIGLHTGTTGTTGTNEYPSVTRQPVIWSSPSGGVVSNTATLTFTTSGATPVTFAGGWSALTAGTFEHGYTLGSSVTAASITIPAGQLTSAAS